MLRALEDGNNRACVLFPTDDARVFADLERDDARDARAELAIGGDDRSRSQGGGASNEGRRGDDGDSDEGWDVVVLDGTWAQARKLHALLPRGAPRVCLSDASVAELGAVAPGGAGHQLRRHSVTWRQVSTCEATRLLLRDMGEPPSVVAALGHYQEVANAAALRQIGPPRPRQNAKKQKGGPTSR